MNPFDLLVKFALVFGDKECGVLMMPSFRLWRFICDGCALFVNYDGDVTFSIKMAHTSILLVEDVDEVEHLTNKEMWKELLYDFLERR